MHREDLEDRRRDLTIEITSIELALDRCLSQKAYWDLEDKYTDLLQELREVEDQLDS